MYYPNIIIVYDLSNNWIFSFKPNIIIFWFFSTNFCAVFLYLYQIYILKSVISILFTNISKSKFL